MSGIDPFWLIVGIIVVIIAVVRSERTKDRRADYNRSIGEPDLAAPLPSEMYAAQRSGPGKIIWALVIIALVVFFFLPALRVIL